MGGVLVVGEALVDVVVRPDGSSTEHPGGSPLNVAIGLARLGRPTQLLTRVGHDERGRSVLEHLARSGVDVVAGSVVEGSTSVATATLARDGSARYAFDLVWEIDEVALPPDPLAVHVGSIGAVLEPGGSAVQDIVSGLAGRATTSYDPNLRPALMGSPDRVRPRVEALVAASDVVKLSEEDAAWLEPGTGPEDLAARWLGLGPALVVLTRGGDGLVGLARSGRVTAAAPRVGVADTVGAGDSAMAALLDGLWQHDLLGGPARQALRAVEPTTVEAVLRHAATAAAITVSRPGADPPWRTELA